jgi:hypothetical protein
VALSILDSPQLQRLRRVSQLGFCSLVYPCANHTRFEHSLGVYYLASRLSKRLDDISEDELVDFRLACLIHDVGHPPFSHTFEDILFRYDGLHHTDILKIFGRCEMADILSEHGISLRVIENMVHGNGMFGPLLSSEIDLDRMDYLRRDAYYTGVGYGLVDVEHLLHEIALKNGRAVIGKGGLHAGESLLISRFLMYPTVYAHHVPRIAGCMLSHALSEMLEEKELKPNEARMMCDWELLESMRGKKIVEDVLRRRLYKRALFVGLKDVGENVVEYRGRERRLAYEIAEEAGIEPENVLVDIPPYPEMEEKRARIEIAEGEFKQLFELSPLVRALEKAHIESWRMGVYSPKEYVDRVSKKAKDILGVSSSVQQTLW